MFVYKSGFLTRGEVWFDEEPDDTRVDWVCHRQRSNPLLGFRSRRFYTRLIDLRQSPTELLAHMDEKITRRIRDAQEIDHLRWERCDSSDSQLIDRVETMWNEFAIAQNTLRFDRAWLEPLRQAGKLDLSAARDPRGNVMVYHLVLLAGPRARHLMAISSYKPAPTVAWRIAVSRANCFVLWKDFLAFREQNIAYFDFGGWYPGTTNIQFLGINRFKQGFGGRVIAEYVCDQPVTLKGWLLLTMARLLNQIKNVRAYGSRSGVEIAGPNPHETGKSPAPSLADFKSPPNAHPSEPAVNSSAS